MVYKPLHGRYMSRRAVWDDDEVGPLLNLGISSEAISRESFYEVDNVGQRLGIRRS